MILEFSSSNWEIYQELHYLPHPASACPCPQVDDGIYLLQFFPSFVSCWTSNMATGIQVRGQAAGEEVGYKWHS